MEEILFATREDSGQIDLSQPLRGTQNAAEMDRALGYVFAIEVN